MTEQLEIIRQEVIEDTPFPGQVVFEDDAQQKDSKSTITSLKSSDKSFPVRRPAVDVISSSLNTRSQRILGEFQFTQAGALQIGTYESGVSGDMRLSPNGITARNSAGITTFSIDGTTGDATFAGTIQAGTLISGQVIVGNNNLILDGTEKQIIVNDGNNDIILIGKQVGGF